MDDVSDDAALEARLRPAATALIRDEGDAAGYLDAITAMAISMPPDRLRASMDYVLFPVTRVMRRESAPPTASSASDPSPSSPAPLAPSARAARRRALESSIRCVGSVVRRADSCGATPDAAMDLLSVLVSVLASCARERDADAESLRVAAVATLRDAIAALHPTRDRPALLSDPVRPVFGYCVSLLLDVAHAEAIAGAQGSRALRADALRALRDLVRAAEDDPDGLAFFLPGIVSGLVRAVAAGAGTRPGHGAGPASAAEDSAAAEAAARALADVTRAVMRDDSFDPRTLREFDEDGGEDSDEAGEDGDEAASATSATSAASATSALAERLRRLAARSSSRGKSSSSTGPLNPDSDPSSSPSLRATRDAGWLRDASPRVSGAIASAFASLETHPKPSVRAAAGASACVVLRACRRTLRAATRSLTETALAVYRDPWPAASAETRDALRAASLAGEMHRETLDDILRDAFDALPRAVREGSAKGAATARRTLAAMDVAGRDATETTLATRANVRIAATTSLARCFAVGDGGVGAGGAGGIGGAGVFDSASVFAADAASAAHSAHSSASSLARRRAAHLSDPELYGEIAAVARALGGYLGALPALVAARLDALRETLEVSSANEGDQSSTSMWRRGACAHVVALNETLLGAAERREAEVLKTAESLATVARETRTVRLRDETRYVRLRDATATARAVLDEYLREDVWNLPTSVEDLRRERARRTGQGTGGDGDGSTPTRFASEVGGFDSDAATVRENALLVSLAAEGLGAAARVGGREFIRRGGFLPLALCPLLRRLGDPAPDVRDAARHALEVTARVGGYYPDEGTEEGEEGGDPPAASSTPASSTPITALVAANADYVVSELSRRLRRLADHPDAARFFAAALGRRASSARLLLPLLSEPVGRALDALSIARRRAHDGDVAALLDVARSVADAVEEDAKAIAVEAEEAWAEARPLAAMLDEMREFQEENDAISPGEEETSSTSSPDDPETTLLSSNLRSLVASSPHRDACVSFDASATMSAWRRRARRESNLSRLATSVLSAAAPLMESSDDGRRVSACEACASALRALRGVETCVETDRETLETVRRLFPGDAPDAAEESQSRPAKLLPRVHAAWPHLAAALGHRLGPAASPEPLRAALATLETAAKVSGGSFIARRFARDAWPNLAVVLERGVPRAAKTTVASRLEQLYHLGDGTRRHGGHAAIGENHSAIASSSAADAEDDASASRRSESARRFIFQTMANIAANETSRGALTDVARLAAEQTTERALRRGGDERTRTAAEAAARGLAAVDPDAAWLRWTLEATGRDESPTPVAPTWKQTDGTKDDDGTKDENGTDDIDGTDGESRVCGSSSGSEWTSSLPTLPSFREICPAPKASTPERRARDALALLTSCGLAAVRVEDGGGTETGGTETRAEA